MSSGPRRGIHAANFVAEPTTRSHQRRAQTPRRPESPAGPLEEPWAFVLAPEDFGRFGGALLIGNFGNGHINAYNYETGEFLGQLADEQGNALSSGLGLWALSFGNKSGEGDEGEKNRLFFTSGVNNETDGLFGYIVSTKKGKE
jgi:uncharacterized protein (TIGR03118 family)